MIDIILFVFDFTTKYEINYVWLHTLAEVETLSNIIVSNIRTGISGYILRYH